MKTESAKLGERVGNSGQLAFLLRDPRRVEVTGPETWKLIAPRPEAVFFALMVLPGTILIEPVFNRVLIFFAVSLAFLRDTRPVLPRLLTVRVVIPRVWASVLVRSTQRAEK